MNRCSSSKLVIERVNLSDLSQARTDRLVTLLVPVSTVVRIADCCPFSSNLLLILIFLSESCIPQRNLPAKYYYADINVA